MMGKNKVRKGNPHHCIKVDWYRQASHQGQKNDLAVRVSTQMEVNMSSASARDSPKSHKERACANERFATSVRPARAGFAPEEPKARSRNNDWLSCREPDNLPRRIQSRADMRANQRGATPPISSTPTIGAPYGYQPRAWRVFRPGFRMYGPGGGTPPPPPTTSKCGAWAHKARAQ